MLPDLPCGCPASKQFAVMLLPDGSRICRAHGKRYRTSWVEETTAILSTAFPAAKPKRTKAVPVTPAN